MTVRLHFKFKFGAGTVKNQYHSSKKKGKKIETERKS